MTDHEAIQSLLAPYALDAVDVDEVLEIEAHLDTCAECADALAELRDTVDLLATLPGATRPARPDPFLAARTMAAALAHRPARSVTFAPAEVHLIESTRLLGLLSGLTPAQWSVPVGADLPDWDVHDLAAHLAASEALLAESLGARRFTPEVADQPTPRAHAAVERHRSLTPAQTVAELETAYSLVQAAVIGLGADATTHLVPWFGLELALGDVLVQRAFEIWTHADDIRRALDLALLPPPAPSLAVMSATAIQTIPFLLATAAVSAEGRRARITLEGAGGHTFHVDLGLEPMAPSGAAHPDTADVAIELDVVDFCRSLADRLPADHLRYRAAGDTELAAALVSSLPGLAVL
jgi:uncharacterized protein (TIGR03083 family)